MLKVTGLDVGGTKIRGVVWNGRKVLKVLEVPTPKNLADFKSSLLKVATALGKTDRICAGVAGIISGKNVKKSPNIPYIKNLDFSFMGDLKPQKLDNDARCFARAEYLAGKYRGRTVFFVVVGTGVGRAVVKNGRVLKIKKFEYPEPWEKQYQKIRDSKDTAKLAEFFGKKITELAKPFKPGCIVIGGGVLRQKGFLQNLRKQINIPVKKSILGKNSPSIGAAMLFKQIQ